MTLVGKQMDYRGHGLKLLVGHTLAEVKEGCILRRGEAKGGRDCAFGWVYTNRPKPKFPLHSTATLISTPSIHIIFSSVEFVVLFKTCKCKLNFTY